MISLKQAYEILFSQSLQFQTQEVDIFASLGKVLAEDIIASRNLPAFSNSAMDGYVVSEIAESYKLTHTILAGEIPPSIIPQGECYKIMTGAKVPSNALAVIPFENASLSENIMQPTQEVKEGANIKLEGEECKSGEAMLQKGEKLTYRSLSLLASQGIAKLKVFSPLKIAIYSSGDEVVELGEVAEEQQIYNVNALAYHSFLLSYGFSSTYQGILRDDLQSITKEIENFANFDVVFTSGGASVGEADFFEKALLKRGAEILFHGINLKPGRPMLVAKLGKTYIFSLPGNPLSGLFNLATLALPTLHKLSGSKQFFPTPLKAKNKSTFRLKSGRSNMILGIFDGEFFEAYKGGKYGSGAIFPIKESNAIAIFDECYSSVEAGEKLQILPLPFSLSESKDSYEWINFEMTPLK